MVDNRETHVFGYGTYFKEKDAQVPADPKILEGEVRLLGWSHGCPIVDEVMRDYGTINAFHRYSNCNRTTTDMLNKLQSLPYLRTFFALQRPQFRNRAVGKHEAHNVPDTHYGQMAPLATPPGYANARLLIAHAENLQNLGFDSIDIKNSQDAVIYASADTSASAEQFTINMAERIIMRMQKPEQIVDLFGHIFARNVLEEERCDEIFSDMANFMDTKTTFLSNAYLALPAYLSQLDKPMTMQEAGIIQFR